MLRAVVQATSLLSKDETAGEPEQGAREEPARTRRPVSEAETERRRRQMSEQGQIVAERYRQLRQGRS